MKKKYLGIIPARGGSKGIPMKNIKNMNKKPLIAHTIEVANKAVELGIMNRCIVSTDSSKIADVSREFGADIPFMRPSYLGEDSTKSVDVILHALSLLEERGEYYDAVVTLQPTSPMRNLEDLVNGIEMFDKESSDSLITVYEDVKANGFGYYRMCENHRGKPEHKEHNMGIRRQEMRPMYVRNGALYVTTTALLKRQKVLIGDNPLLFVMPKERSIDVDSPIDFEYIEFLMQKQ